MSVRLRKISILLIFPLFALAFFLGAYFFYYRGGYDAPPTTAIPFDSIVRPTSSHSTFTEVPQQRPGMLVVHGGHSNEFSKGEISSLLARVSDRGHDIEFIGEPGFFGGFGLLDSGVRVDLLEEKLRQANSLAVILPDEAYTPEEVGLVERFVAKGGRLLLVADPTRRSEINSLAERFGINFLPDYLFNTVDYDINFQNIII